MKKGIAFTLTLAALLAICFVDSISAEPRPVEDFAKLPPYRDIALSADGSKAVALRAIQGTYHAVLLDFEGGQSRMLMAADPSTFLFNWCEFANPTRVICSIRSYIKLRAGQYQPGFRFYRESRTTITRMIAIDIDGSNQLQLVPEARTRTGGDLEWNAPRQDDIISWLPDDPEHILIQLPRDDRIHPTVYRLNIYNNKMRRVQRHLPSIARWYADPDGRIRFATGRKNFREAVAYSFQSGKRVEVDVSHLAGLNLAEIINLHADDESVYVIGNLDTNTRGVHRVSLTNGEVIETVWQHEQFDAELYLDNEHQKELLYVGYNEDGQHLTWFNDALAKEVSTIRANLGGPKYIRFFSITPNLSHFVIRVHGNGVDPAIYRYTRKDKSLQLLATESVKREVDMHYVTYAARDETIIPAYLALPGPVEDGPYPTIIDPHGGPWSESQGYSDFVTEFLVNRGYAVLQPNFRGSTGYGDAYLRAGFREWGGKMQDDVIDGLKWLIDEGITDPERTCISGGSYGGYTALVAAYKTPELFKCAISFAGVTDLEALSKTLHLFLLGHFTQARLPKGEALLSNSPIYNVDKMKVPLLIVHGDVDRSVFIEQSRTLVDKLKEAGKEHIYIEQPNGDHFFSLEPHRLEFLQAMDAFLAKYLD